MIDVLVMKSHSPQNSGILSLFRLANSAQVSEIWILEPNSATCVHGYIYGADRSPTAVNSLTVQYFTHSLTVRI